MTGHQGYLKDKSSEDLIPAIKFMRKVDNSKAYVKKRAFRNWKVSSVTLDVTCHLSCVTCHMSYVTCHMSHDSRHKTCFT